MHCEFDRTLVSLYADRALRRELCSHVEDHLRGCAECRQTFEFIQELGIVLSSLPKERSPEKLIQHIIADVSDTTHHPVWITVYWTFTAVLTMVTHGFRIEDDQECVLRRELPMWIMRWVLFV